MGRFNGGKSRGALDFLRSPGGVRKEQKDLSDKRTALKKARVKYTWSRFISQNYVSDT